MCFFESNHENKETRILRMWPLSSSSISLPGEFSSTYGLLGIFISMDLVCRRIVNTQPANVCVCVEQHNRTELGSNQGVQVILCFKAIGRGKEKRAHVVATLRGSGGSPPLPPHQRQRVSNMASKLRQVNVWRNTKLYSLSQVERERKAR